jgi:hypothetical protein
VRKTPRTDFNKKYAKSSTRAKLLISLEQG